MDEDEIQDDAYTSESSHGYENQDVLLMSDSTDELELPYQPPGIHPGRFIMPGMAQLGIPQSLSGHEAMSFVEHGIEPLSYTTFASTVGIPWHQLQLRPMQDDKFVIFYGRVILQHRYWPQVWIQTLSVSLDGIRTVKIGTDSCEGYRGERFLGFETERLGLPNPLQWSRFVRLMEIFMETLAVVAAFRREVALAAIPSRVFKLIKLARLYLIQADYERLKGLRWMKWANETKEYFNHGESGRDRRAKNLQDWDADGILDGLWEDIKRILDKVNRDGGWCVFNQRVANP